jgi:flagellar biosynthesis/type III secretory pathway ATPase
MGCEERFSLIGERERERISFIHSQMVIDTSLKRVLIIAEKSYLVERTAIKCTYL